MTTETTFFSFFLSPKGKMEKDDYITGNLIIFGVALVLFLLRKYLPNISHIAIIISGLFIYYVIIAMGLKRLRDANLPIWFIAFFVPIRFMSVPVAITFLCFYNRRKNKKILN